MKYLFVCLAIFSSQVFAADDLAKILDAEVSKSGMARDKLGLVVSQFTPRGEGVVYRLNEGVQFIPASSTKVITAAAALEYLGAGSKLITELRSPGKIVDGILKGVS